MVTTNAANSAANDRWGASGSGPERIPSLDVLRGVAVLGILLINISIFALPPGAQVVPDDPAPGQVADFYVWVFNEIFVEGTMRGLFSLLFGASMVLMTGMALSAPPHSPHPLDLYARRSLWLIVFGLFHAYVLLWPYDILYAYGLLGLLLLPLRVMAVRPLVLAGLCLLGMGALISAFQVSQQTGNPRSSGFELSHRMDEDMLLRFMPEGLEDVTPLNGEIRLSAASAEARDAIDTRRSGYLDNFSDMAAETALLQSKGLYQTSVFDIGGMMLIGMALLKAGVLNGRRSRRFYGLMLVGGYGTGLAVNGTEVLVSVMEQPGSATLYYWSKVTYDVGRLPMMLGHVAALILLMKARRFDFPLRLLSAAGRMALTNYVMQTVICNTLFLGAGFGLYGSLGLYQLMIVALAIAALQIAVSVLWLRNYRMGPLEWALRSLSRWSPQPLRHRVPAGDPAAAGAAGR